MYNNMIASLIKNASGEASKVALPVAGVAASWNEFPVFAHSFIRTNKVLILLYPPTKRRTHADTSSQRSAPHVLVMQMRSPPSLN